MRKLDVGSLLVGLFFAAVGMGFLFEALGVWTFRVGDLRLVGPAVLVIAGLGVMASAVARNR
jgi:hypothetical protein